MIRDRVILFIHFSKTIDDYLLESIKITRMNAPNTRIFLISDNDDYIKRTREFLVIFKKQSKLLNESVLQYYSTHYPNKSYDRRNFCYIYILLTRSMYLILTFYVSLTHMMTVFWYHSRHLHLPRLLQHLCLRHLNRQMLQPLLSLRTLQPHLSPQLTQHFRPPPSTN